MTVAQQEELRVPVKETGGGEDANRNLGVLGMVSIGFFWVSGGGYGNETLIYNGPPLVVLATIVLLPLFYCLPISFIVAELSTAISADSGPTVWATRASNYKIGMHNAYWSVVAWVVDSAAYPVVAAEYVTSGTAQCADPDAQTCVFMRSGFAAGMVFTVTALKLLGLDFIVKFSSLLAIGALLPSIAFVFGGVFRLNPSTWVQTTGAPLNMLPLGSWILWLNSGFFGVGALAGQVKRPIRKTLLSATLWLIFITVMCILLPLIVSYSVDPDWTHYKKPGQFATLAGDMYGPWMMQTFQAGAVMSNIGLYNALMMQGEVAGMYVMKELFPDLIRPWTEKAIVVTFGLLTMGLVWLDYNLLVQCSMLLFSFPSLLIFYSFFALRIKEPHLERPFKVPGGCFFAILISICPIALTLGNLALNMDPWQDGFVIRVSGFVGMLVIGFGAMLIPGMNERCRQQAERSDAVTKPLLNPADGDGRERGGEG